jgi:hypothetical protein
MTDHHDDFGDHHFDQDHDHDYAADDLHHDALNHDDQHQYDDDPTPDHFEHPDYHEPHTDEPAPDHHIAAADDLHVTGQPTHHDTTADYDDPAPADVFPPPVDVGELPEPVDGFPWTDAATLGDPDLGPHHVLEPVDPHELAEYAGTEIPPGADPWTVLAASDDPATSTLARFWHDTTE